MLKRLLISNCVIVMLSFIGFRAMAESISSVIVTNSAGSAFTSICSGASINVSFSATGFITAGTFSVQLSDAAGTFGSPTTIATGAASPITTTIPANTPAGSTYKVRVVRSGIASAGSLAFAVSVAPTSAPATTTSISLCQNQTSSALVATPTAGNSIQWYASDNATAIAAPTPPTSTPGNIQYYVTQKNGNCEYTPRTLVTVTIISVAAPTVASPINYCVGDAASALTANGSNLKWYTTASGGTPLGSAPVPSTASASSNTYYVSSSNGSCESSRTSLTVNVNARPSAPATNASINLCAGQSPVTLSATPTSGNTLRWYSSDNVLLGSAPTPSTNVNNTTVSNYLVSQVSAQGCESTRTGITVTVNYTTPPSFAPGTGIPILACQNQASPNLGNIIVGTGGHTLLWYGTNSTGGSSSTTPSVVSTSGVGSANYYVSQKNNSTNCESNRIGINVQVNAVPNAPSVTSPVNLCQNGPGTTLSASASSGANLLWWGTNSSGGSPSNTAPTISTSSTGNTTYYVSQQANNCESSRAPINVIVNSVPTAPVTTNSNVLYCKDAVATALSATASGGNTLRWYVGNNVQNNAPTPSTAVGSTTTTDYFVSQISPSPANCESPRTQITTTVYVSPTPSVNSPVVYCQFNGASALTATTQNGANVKWYDVASGGGALSGAPTPSTNTSGTTNYYVSQTLFASGSFGGCESPRANISVVVNPQPAAPTVSNPAPYCQNYGSQALTAQGSSLKWYNAPTGGTGTNNAPTPSTSNVGNTNFYVSQTNNFNCEGPRATITVTINPTPNAPTVTALTYCQNQTVPALTATANDNNQLKWYGTDANGGTASTNAPVPTTAGVGTWNYYVTQTNGFSCESPRAKLDVLINPTPNAPSTSSVVYCATANAQPLTASGENLKWYTQATGGTGNSSAPTPSTENSSNTTAAVTNYYVTQTNGFSCESPKATLEVRIKPLPVSAEVPKTEYLLCQFDPSTQLQAKTVGTNTSLVWILPDTRTETTAPTITTEGAFEGNFGVRQQLDGCLGFTTSIKVQVRTTPKPDVSNIPVVLCQNQPTSPLSATGSNLKWYGTNKTGGTAQTTPDSPPTTTPGNYTFYVTQTGTNGCESPRAEISVVIQPLPSATISGGASITQGQPTTLTINFTGQGPWTYTLSNGFSETVPVNQNPRVISVFPLENTVYTVTKITNNCGEGTPAGSATISVKVANIEVGTPNTTSTCAGTSFNVPYFSSDFFPANTSFKVQISKSTDDVSFQTIPTEGNATPLKATIPPNTPGGAYYIRVVAIASEPTFMVRGQRSPQQITIRELPTATLSGPTSIYENESAKLSISLTGEPSWTVVYKDSLAQKDTTLIASTSPVEVSVKPGKTNVYSIVSISNACGNGSATSKFKLIVNPVLSINPTLQNKEWLRVYPTPTENYCTIEVKDGNAKHILISILDASGKEVFRRESYHQDKIDLSNLAIGEYYLNANQDGRISRHKLLKIQ